MTSLALTHAPSLCRTPFRCSTPSLQCRLYPHAAPTNSHIMTSQLGPFVCLLCVASCECTRLLNPQGIANGPQDLSAHQRRRKELYLKRKQSCNLLPRLCLLPSLLPFLLPSLSRASCFSQQLRNMLTFSFTITLISVRDEI